MADEFHPHSLDASIARLNTIADRVEKRLDDGEERFDEIDKRVRKLESWKYYIVGGAAVLAALIRAAWDWFVNNGPDMHGKH